ncbi:transglutaminaseTgpA domain-containing protein [Colwelliaceae bacterium 6441]
MTIIKDENKQHDLAFLLFVKQRFFTFIAVQIVNLIILVPQLELWLIALAGVCIFWQVGIFTNHIARPSKVIKFFAALTGCVVLAISAINLGVLLTMLHLLCLSYLLKPLELKTRKDFYQFVLLGIFILATSLIFYQSIYFFAAVFVILVLNLAVLSSYFSNDKTLILDYKTSFKLVILSLPLTLCLFFLFPKISPFWHVPTASSAKTGLNDNVTIGDISSLALSNDLAFRAEFLSAPPSYQQMYWRALVLENFDGTHWRRKPMTKRDIVKNVGINLNEAGRLLTYQVIVEPSDQYWLFSLASTKVDKVTQAKIIYQLKDDTLVSREKVNQRFSYQATSASSPFKQIAVSDDIKQRNLSISQKANPKLRALAVDLRQLFKDNRALIHAVLDHFRIQNYRYTLNPPPIYDHSLDTFYFETQAGFCEHYASSFTFLMRAAGIPARMVVGYLGGEYNAQGNYYSIRQRDAHAWSEVWLAEEGWVRVDPTSAVDPSRVEKGFSTQLLSEQESLSQDFVFSSYFDALWLAQLRSKFSALDYQWTKLVINFSQNKQRSLLLSWFGDGYFVKSVIVIVAVIALTAGFIWLLFIIKNRSKKTAIWITYYQKSHLAMKKLGLKKSNEQSESQFIDEILQFDHNLGQCYKQLSTSFHHLHYGKNTELVKKQRIKMMAAEYQQFIDMLKSLNTRVEHT